jgi:hypothetical protein
MGESKMRVIVSIVFRKNLAHLAILVALVLGVGVSLVIAQVPTGSIVGTVVDPHKV